MNKPTGGRGKKAPYETVVMRVPLPISQRVEKEIEDYREFVVSGTSSSLDSQETAEVTLPSHSEAIAHAKEILKQKKSAKQSLEKLLQVLYGEKTDLKD